MIGQMANDRGISTIQTSAFNYDGEKRDFLDMEEARSILDYDVLVKPCKTQEGVDIPGLNYLEKSTDGSLIPCAGIGDRFQPYDNRKFFDYFTGEVMPQIPELRLETVATLHGSGTALITTNMGEDFHVQGDESPNKFRVLFCNSNNGTACLQLGFTTVRVVCMNTLAMAREEVKNDQNAFRIHHTESAESRVNEAVKVIYARLAQMSRMKERIERLASKEVNSAVLTRALNRIYPLDGYPADKSIVSPGRTRMENLRAEVVRQFESGETANTFTNMSGWRLFNAFTQPLFASKKPTGLKKAPRTDRAEIAFRGSVGDVGDKVSRWFNVVEQEAFGVAA